MDPYPRTWAEIDLGALAHNLETAKKLFAPAQICLVCKADGYGHGLTIVGRHAVRTGIGWLAVATVSEAVALRDAGISARIIVLSPILAIEADLAVFYDLDIVVERAEMIEALADASAKQGRHARIHVKIDSGLNRFGCRPTQAAGLAVLAQSRGLSFAGLSTHFVDSRNNPQKTLEQIRLFDEARQTLADKGLVPEVVHAANSFGAERWGHCRFDMVRIGLHAYGIDGRQDSPFRPVMALKTRVVAERWVPAGDTVGYNAAWQAKRRSRILTLGAGYGDGYPRHLSSKGSVVVHGQKAPVVGMVCMDLTMVDGTDVPEAKVGDVATLLGDGLTAAQLAAAAGTNAHEIVTRIAPRVPRRMKNA